MRTGSDLLNQVRPEDFTWYLRQVPNWIGSKEYMIELEGIDGCVSFGETIREAKKGCMKHFISGLSDTGKKHFLLLGTMVHN